jgi:SAM-dependent methyltransferase
MSVPQRCPLCTAGPDRQSAVVGQVYGGADQAIFHCSQCDVRYLHPGLDASEEARLYAAEFESFMVNRAASDAGWEAPEQHIKANEGQRLRRMGHLAAVLKPRSRILEVGCSSGFMLYPLVADGHQCVAIEPSGVFSDYVCQRGLSCFPSVEAMTAAGEAKGGFDLILHYYVMEHIGDPASFLREQMKLLRLGGRIVFEVPNVNDALTTIYKIPAYERFIWVVSHRWYFSEMSLSHLIESAGGKGEVRLDQRYDLSNHMVWARDGRPGGMGKFTDVLGEEIESQYRQALIKAGRCDTLIGIVGTGS